jgi:hypothetical protein
MRANCKPEVMWSSAQRTTNRMRTRSGMIDGTETAKGQTRGPRLRAAQGGALGSKSLVNNGRTCVYCGQETNLTNEHVFPECFRKTFEAISTAKTPTGEKAILSALEVHDVCAACNNGPLSQLDTYFCALNNKYFSQIIHRGDRVHFDYDFDRLRRVLLKIGYNVARARKWSRETWKDAAPYVLGGQPCPQGFRVFVQLMIPTPVEKTTLTVTPGTTEVPPLPMRVYLTDVRGLPGLHSEYSVSAWSYRFFILRENTEIRRSARQRTMAKWLRSTKGAYELTHRGVATIYASSVEVLDDAKDSPSFHEQISRARELKSTMETKGTQRV